MEVVIQFVGGSKEGRVTLVYLLFFPGLIFFWYKVLMFCGKSAQFRIKTR